MIREGHWAVGWVEWIGIHQDAQGALQKAEKILAGLEDYPVVDEVDWSALEDAEATEYWLSCSTRHRFELRQEAGDSIFAARPDHPT